MGGFSVFKQETKSREKRKPWTDFRREGDRTHVIHHEQMSQLSCLDKEVNGAFVTTLTTSLSFVPSFPQCFVRATSAPTGMLCCRAPWTSRCPTQEILRYAAQGVTSQLWGDAMFCSTQSETHLALRNASVVSVLADLCALP